jgi:hypothetical protein
VSVRQWAEFRTELPLDWVEDETDIVEFPGRNVTEAIAAMLASLGYDVSAPIHAGEHGWELDVRANGRRFWLQITRMEEHDCHLTTQDMTWRIWRLQPSFEEFLTQLDRALREDGRFSQIGWFRDRKDETRSPHPVEAS